MYSPPENEHTLAAGRVGEQTRSIVVPRKAFDRVTLPEVLSEKAGWIAALLMLGAYIAYFAQLTSFPFQDYPNHLARGAALADLIFHHGERFGRLFEFHFTLVPYILHDLILAACIELFGAAAGGAIFSALVLLSLPLALLFYMRVNNLAPRARWLVFLLALYLATDWFFLMAFMAFRLALALIIVNLALADLLRRSWSLRLFCVYIGVLLVGYLIHLTSIAFFAPLLAVSGFVRLWAGTTSPRRELWLLTPVVALLALHFGLVVDPYSATNPPAYSFFWGGPHTKLRNLTYEFERFDGRPSRPMMLMFAACLLWPIRHAVNRQTLAKPAVLEHLISAIMFLGVYILLPQQYADSSFVDVRALPVVTLALLLACLHLPDERSAGTTFNTLPVLGLAAVLAMCNLGYLALHMGRNDAWLAGYRRVVARIPPNSNVLPVHTRKTQMHIAPFLHAGSFAVLDRTAVIPYLFSGDRGDPMKYFRYRYKPYTPDESWYLSRKSWNKATERTVEVQGRQYRWRFDIEPGEWYWHMVDLVPVDWNRVACDYDFLLLTAPYDPDLVGVPTKPVAVNASAALLAVDKRACHPQAPQRNIVRLPGERS
jgi:hypothetical protein